MNRKQKLSYSGRPLLKRFNHAFGRQMRWPRPAGHGRSLLSEDMVPMPQASSPSAQYSGSDRLIDRIEAGHQLPSHLRGAIIALGNFDGLHLGHQAVVGRAIDMARERGVAAIVGSFDPHPVDHFKPGAAPFRLTTLAQRQGLLTAAGADALLVFPFNAALARVTPEDFVTHWLGGASGAVTGEDFTFGRDRAGDVEMLAALGAKQGLIATTVKPVQHDGGIVSSTRIRQALQAGDCATATRLLTRPFTIEGILQAHPDLLLQHGVMHAKIELDAYLRPANGLYAVQMRRPNGSMQDGIARLSCSPSAPAQDRLELIFPVPTPEAYGELVKIVFNGKICDD